jgi:hypothetical protein
VPTLNNMLILSKPAKAFLVLFVLTVSVSMYGLLDTVLTIGLFLGGMFIYKMIIEKPTL